ncbi:MAG: hypothetical protein ACQ9MH_15070, partial [Nitrospinales bacterium]
ENKKIINFLLTGGYRMYLSFCAFACILNISLSADIWFSVMISKKSPFPSSHNILAIFSIDTL